METPLKIIGGVTPFQAVNSHVNPNFCVSFALVRINSLNGEGGNSSERYVMKLNMTRVAIS